MTGEMKDNKILEFSGDWDKLQEKNVFTQTVVVISFHSLSQVFVLDYFHKQPLTFRT